MDMDMDMDTTNQCWLSRSPSHISQGQELGRLGRPV